MILLLFSFAFDPQRRDHARNLRRPAVDRFAFAGTLMLNRSFARELPNDCLDALIAAPISGPALFLGKALANFVLVLAVELVALPVFGDLLQCAVDAAILAVDAGAGCWPPGA